MKAMYVEQGIFFKNPEKGLLEGCQNLSVPVRPALKSWQKNDLSTAYKA